MVDQNLEVVKRRSYWRNNDDANGNIFPWQSQRIATIALKLFPKFAEPFLLPKLSCRTSEGSVQWIYNKSRYGKPVSLQLSESQFVFKDISVWSLFLAKGNKAFPHLTTRENVQKLSVAFGRLSQEFVSVELKALSFGNNVLRISSKDRREPRLKSQRQS